MNKLKNIKNILSNYKPEYDENIWIKIEKQLPKSKISPLKKIIIGSASGLAVFLVIIMAYNIYNNSTNVAVIQLPTKTLTAHSVIANNNISENQSEKTVVNKQNIQTLKENNNKISEKIVTNSTINPESENKLAEKQFFLPQNSENTKPAETTNLQTNEIKEINKTNNLSEIIFKVEQVSNCIPAKFRFSAENIPDDYSISWKTGDNNQIYGSVAEYSYTLKGNYQPVAIVAKNNFVIKTENLPVVKIYSPTSATISYRNDYKTSYTFSSDTDTKNEAIWTINGENFYDKQVSYDFEKSGNYIINLKITEKNGCISFASKQINIKDEQLFYLPTAFMANSAGANSTFGPIGENLEFQQYVLMIKDIQGNTVFSTQNINEQWNGKQNNIGQELPVGVYGWEIKTVDFSNNVETKKGKVNLFRQ